MAFVFGRETQQFRRISQIQTGLTQAAFSAAMGVGAST